MQGSNESIEESTITVKFVEPKESVTFQNVVLIQMHEF